MVDRFIAHACKLPPSDRFLQLSQNMLIEKALDIACSKQKEIIINRNNPWHKGTLKQLRLEKFARYEEYTKVRTNVENKTKYYNTLNKYRRLCRQKQKKKHERDQTEAMGNEAEMSKYLNKILKNKAKKDIGTLMGNTRPQE